MKVKKGYTYLQDADQPSQWSRSLAGLFSSSTPQPPQAPPAAQVPGNSPRASTSSDPEDISRPTLRRSSVPSKVSRHIMSTTRRIPFSSNRERDQDPFGSSDPGRNYPYMRRRCNSAMVSIEGQQAEVLKPSPGEPGRIGSAHSLPNSDIHQDFLDEIHHNDDIVEHLDVIDPQIATVSTLTNAANSITSLVFLFPQTGGGSTRTPQLPAGKEDPEKGKHTNAPHEDALDQHVEDVLRKRDKFRRVMQGVWSFVKTRMFGFPDFVAAIYGFLVGELAVRSSRLLVDSSRFKYFGALVSSSFWPSLSIYTMKTQRLLGRAVPTSRDCLLCHASAHVLSLGLFTATSIGFIPFRVMDTYRVFKIWHYKRRIAKLRQKAGLPELYDADDLPDPIYDPNYVHVLTEDEQIDLHYPQIQGVSDVVSATWNRNTSSISYQVSFPYALAYSQLMRSSLAVWICILNDLNSFFQCLLSGTMWGLDRFQRPAWTTATTLPAAFIAGILAGFYIYWGGRKTRRTQQVEDRLRVALDMERSPEHPSTVVTGGNSSTMAAVLNATQSTPIMRQQQSPSQGSDFAGEKIPPERASVTSIPLADEMIVPQVADVIR
ncbi:hypothetical protein A0H81_09965 [Grifola frondosa]|uniref:Uncharacterized protein n=1 Tax=Grifola frondosa TaxID=5627 RepID=A0A1C7M0K5_GRIFR|nr:hypothetical protein A0H81_09965 [Grifola frondosa]